MNKDNDHIDLFDSYLQGQLDREARLSFEERLQSDYAFREAFQLYKKSLLIVESMAVREEVAEYFNTNAIENNNKSWKWIRIAASISIVAFFSLLLYTKPSSESIFESYYSPYPNVISVRDVNTDWGILNAYSNEDFIQSVDVLVRAEQNDTVQFYLAMSYLSSNSPYKADSVLNKISLKSVFSEQVQWYSALASLAQGESSKTVEKLKSIEENEFKYQEAADLIERLE